MVTVPRTPLSDGREDPKATGERVTRGGDYLFDTEPSRLTTYFRGGFSRAPSEAIATSALVAAPMRNE